MHPSDPDHDQNLRRDNLRRDLDDAPVQAAGSRDAADQTDRLILSVADQEAGLGQGGDIVVLDDVTGALVDAALQASAETGVVIAHCTSRRRALEIAEDFSAQHREGRLVIGGVPSPQGEERPGDLSGLLRGTNPRIALLRLPKSLRALDSRARHLVAHAGDADLVLVAGGRVKHMTRSQNEVLEQVFGEVHTTRGLAKSRGIVATSPRRGSGCQALAVSSAPVSIRGRRTPIALRGVGGVFSGAGADAGSKLLLKAVDSALVAGRLVRDGLPVSTAVDLGSGNGLLTAYLALALPEAVVIGSDDDLDAFYATRATLGANGIAASEEDDPMSMDGDGGMTDGDTTDGPEKGTELSPSDTPVADRREPQAQVHWDDSLARLPDASVDLVLLNPPFHDGAGIDATMVQEMLDAAARVLRRHGQLWMVHNSHLRYRQEVEDRVGPTEQAGRDRRFTVLSARRA